MIHPVRPPSSSHEAGEGMHHQNAEEEEPEVDLKDALLDDPIVGVEAVTWDEHGAGARQARPLPTPKAMSKAQKEIHDLTHLPFDEGCEICQATRGLNSQHRLVLEQSRVIPLLVADYCFVRFANSTTIRTIRVMRLYPYRLVVACCVPPQWGG